MMGKEVRRQAGDLISDCVNRGSFTDEDMEKIHQLYQKEFERLIEEIKITILQELHHNLSFFSWWQALKERWLKEEK